jgi:hypothetical protein
VPLEQSILTSTKKVLNVGTGDTSFDQDIITHINSAFSNLYQLGIGPLDGFTIDDDQTEWDALQLPTEAMTNLAKTYIFLRVRTLFDPPQLPHVAAALQKQIEEHEFRLSVMREETEWSDPDPQDTVVIDGGDPSGDV